MAQKLNRFSLNTTTAGSQNRHCNHQQVRKPLKDEKSTSFQQISNVTKPLDKQNPNQKRTALGSISVNAVAQQNQAGQKVKSNEKFSKTSKSFKSVSQAFKKDNDNLKKPPNPFKIFCDDPLPHDRNNTDNKSIPEKNEPEEISTGILSILVNHKQKPVDERRPLAPLPINKNEHWLENVKTSGRDLFNLSAEHESSLIADEPDENSNDAVCVSSSYGDECFAAKQNLTEKERQFNFIFCPPDFVNDIYEHERTRELRLRPSPRYIMKQPHLTSNMRTILVDWMVDVAVEYHLEQETLHLAVNYVDRFLSLMVVDKEKLQLVGTTALLIASKYEEIYPPDLEQFVFITDDSYSMKQVLKMERYLLSTLQFEMSAPTVNFFLDRFLHVCQAEQRCECVAKYLAELVLLDVAFLDFVPSVIAAAVVCLANYSTENVPWPVALEQASQYTVADIYPCMKLVLVAFKQAPDLQVQAVCDKYKENKYCQVALMDPPHCLPRL